MTVPLVQPLPTQASQKLRASIDEVTADEHRLPGVVFAAANKNGKLLFAHASGKRGIDTTEPMTLNSIFWIASCTKLITAIAALQLVEQGKLHLDDADEAEKLCPELKAVKILKGFEDDNSSKPVWQEKKNRITLRMCLSHTAGFGYSFFNNEIRRLGLPAGVDEFSAQFEDVLKVPITFEPGTDWRYGVSVLCDIRRGLTQPDKSRLGWYHG